MEISNVKNIKNYNNINFKEGQKLHYCLSSVNYTKIQLNDSLNFNKDSKRHYISFYF